MKKIPLIFSGIDAKIRGKEPVGIASSGCITKMLCIMNMNKYVKLALVGLWITLSILWCLVTMRLLGAIFVIVCLSVMLLHLRWPNMNAIWGCWLASIISTLIPYDITFTNFDGPPKIVPYVLGYPSDEAFEAAAREEVVLGGCMVPMLAPSKVLVW